MAPTFVRTKRFVTLALFVFGLASTEQVNAQQRLLQPDENFCPPGHIQDDSDWGCRACEPYQQISEDHSTCIEAECEDDEVIEFDGSCRKCQYSRPDAELGHTCVRPDCGTRAKLMSSGFCEECQDYEYMQSLYRCAKPTCEYNEINTVEGTCQICPDHNISSEDKMECFVPTCDERQSVDTNGKCQDCPDYENPTEDSFACEKPVCGNRQMNDWDGTCMDCARNEILISWDWCEFCPDYQQANDDNECGMPTCISKREKVDFRGRCRLCPDYEMPTEDMTDCAFVDCLMNERVFPDGTCEKCDDFMSTTTDPKVCTQPICLYNQKITVEGACEQCPDYHLRSEDSIDTCVHSVCGEREIHTPEGTCQMCPDYEIPDQEAYSCMRRPCEVREKLIKNGDCEICDPYTIVTEDGIGCFKIPCEPTNFIITPEGVCESCDTHFTASKNKKDCHFPVCLMRERADEQGQCEQCEDHFRVSDDGTSCEPPGECQADEVIHSDGQCYPNLVGQTEEQQQQIIELQSSELNLKFQVSVLKNDQEELQYDFEESTNAYEQQISKAQNFFDQQISVFSEKISELSGKFQETDLKLTQEVSTSFNLQQNFDVISEDLAAAKEQLTKLLKGEKNNGLEIRTLNKQVEADQEQMEEMLIEFGKQFDTQAEKNQNALDAQAAQNQQQIEYMQQQMAEQAEEYQAEARDYEDQLDFKDQEKYDLKSYISDLVSIQKRTETELFELKEFKRNLVVKQFVAQMQSPPELIAKDSDTSRKISQEWYDQGSIMDVVDTGTSQVETPMRTLINESQTGELYHINQLQESINDPDTLYNIEILETNEGLTGYSMTLKNLSEKEGVHCCLDMQMETMSGFVRVLKWKQDNYEALTKPIHLYEGQVEQSLPKGFGRFIAPAWDEIFIGYFQTDPQRLFESHYTQVDYDYTKGLYFKDGQLRYQGLYQSGSYYSDSPYYTEGFTDFSKN